MSEKYRHARNFGSNAILKHKRRAFLLIFFWISYPLAVVQRRWTRWATRARDLAAAVVAEDYARAAQIQAEFDALTEEARMHSRG